MPTLNVAPNKSLLQRLTLRRIASLIPTRYQWFKPEALKSTSDLGKVLRALANVLGELRWGIEKQRLNIFTATVTGTDLDLLGTTLGFPRLPNELDATYATRIERELVMNRLTPSAMLLAAPLLSNGTTNTDIFEPWSKIAFRGDKYPRSGSHKRASLRYYHGGVFDIAIDQYVPTLSDFIKRSKAAGTFGYTSLYMYGGIDTNDDVIAAIVPPNFRQNFVSNSFDIEIESFGTATDIQSVVFEVLRNLDIWINAVMVLTIATPLTFENLSRNYVLTADMIASSATGTPVYFVATDTLFAVNEPTDVQPSPEIVQSP